MSKFTMWLMAIFTPVVKIKYENPSDENEATIIFWAHPIFRLLMVINGFKKYYIPTTGETLVFDNTTNKLSVKK